MASTLTVSHSESADDGGGSSNKAPIVIRGARRKRKDRPEFSTCAAMTGEKKNFERETETTDAEECSAKDRFGLEREGGEKSAFRPKTIEDAGVTVDEVEAFKEFFLRANMEARRSPARVAEKLRAQSRPPLPLHWATTRVRSGRLRRSEGGCNSNEDLRAIITSDDGPPPPPLPQPPRQQQHVSESSFSPAGDSQSAITLVKVEGDRACSSAEGAKADAEADAEGEDGQRRRRDQGPGENNDETTPGGSDPDVLDKLASVASNEFSAADSRAESPASPLASQLLAAGSSSVGGVVPKVEASSPDGRSPPPRVVAPARPVKKATVHRRPKVEEGAVESMNPEQAEVKYVSRKKPRPTTGLVQSLQMHQQRELPLLQQHLQRLHAPQPQEQQQLAAVKLEEPDGLCKLALGLPFVSADEKPDEKDVSMMNGHFPDAVAVEKRQLKVEPLLLKLTGRIGSRGPGKTKPALSEQEKEDRKLKRVQANRESARQTIRRKQLQCEELSSKAQRLSSENMRLGKEVELRRRENKTLSDLNSHLRVQVKEEEAKRNPRPPIFATPLSSETPPIGLAQCQHPPSQGMGLPSQPYLWTIAVAPGGIPPAEMNVGAIDYTSASNATAAYGGGAVPAGWNLNSGSQRHSSLAPPYFPSQPLASSITKTLPSCLSFADFGPSISPPTRSISLPVGPGNTSFSLVVSDSASASGKSLTRYNSEDIADFSRYTVDSRIAVDRDAAHRGSSSGGSSRYRTMSMGSQPRMSTAAAVVGRLPMQESGDGNALPLTPTAGHFLGRSHSLAAPHAPKLMHQRNSMFGSVGISRAHERATARETEAQKAAAAATEARRRRKELTRSKSLQHRHTARLAELPA